MTVMTTPSAATVLAALQCARGTCPCHGAARAGQGHTHCPAHDDPGPSLNVTEGDGRILFKCHAGCTQPAVLEALRRLDLWPERAAAKLGTEAAEYRYEYPRNGDGPAYHVRVERPGKPKQMWWEPRGLHPDELPLYRVEELDGRPDEMVLVFEGEKKCDLARSYGFLAVSIPGGAAQRRFGAALHALSGRDVALFPDNDTPGRDVMAHLGGLLTGAARSVRTVVLPRLPPKGDVVDYFMAGGTAEDLLALIGTTTAVTAVDRLKALGIISAPDLLKREFPPQHDVVAGMLSEGAILLSGKPKLGKGWIAVGLALAVASGGKALERLDVDQGEVLYLALEDGERRVKDRVIAVLGQGVPAPPRLHLVFKWNKVGDGCIEDLEAFLDAYPGARLIIVDTLKKVRGVEDTRKRLYDLDYDSLNPFADLGKRRHVCILIIHHNNKLQAAEDLTDLISGSTGMTGSVDGAIVVHGVRNSGVLQMGLSHRDFGGEDWGLRFRTEGVMGWEITGTAAEASVSSQRQEILALFRQESGGPLSAQEVIDLLGKEAAGVRRMLTRMSRSGELISSGTGSHRGYRLSPEPENVIHLSDRSQRSEQSRVSEVSEVSEVRETEPQTSDTSDTRQFPRAGARARDSLVSPLTTLEGATRKVDEWSPEDDPPCPRCGAPLREGYCFMCKERPGEE